MIGIFDIHRSYVICQKNNLIGVYLSFILSGQIFFTYQSTLKKPRYKSSCTSKGIENMDVFIREASFKLFLKDILNRVDDKIHHLYRSIHNTKLFHHPGESGFKELVIKLDNYSLFTFGIIDIRSALANRVIEFIQNSGIL